MSIFLPIYTNQNIAIIPDSAAISAKGTESFTPHSNLRIIAAITIGLSGVKAITKRSLIFFLLG